MKEFKKTTSFLLSFILVISCSIVPVFGTVSNSTEAVTETSDYQSGYSFGRQYESDIENNIKDLFAAAENAGTDMKKARDYAIKSAEIYEDLLPGKLEWIHGVSDAAQIPYEDLLLFNFSDKMIGGLYGECTTFMAQGTAVDGGGTIIAKNRDQSINTLSEVTVNEGAKHPAGSVYKAAYIEIPQAEQTWKFIGSRTAGRWGYGMGVNEHQVIVADNDANSRDLLAFEAGLHDNDVVRLVLERAKTAREGVTIVARLVEKYGQAWNGIMFEIGDPDELWIVEVTGNRWAAKRYTDTVTARSNQYQLTNDYDFAAADLYSFANKMGWYPTGKAVNKMNFRGVYGTLELYPSDNSDIKTRPSAETLYNTQMRYQRAMELLNQEVKLDGKISLQDMCRFTRDHFDKYTLPSGKVVEMNQIPFYSSDLADWYSREWYAETPKKDTIETSIYIRGACSHDIGWGATSATGVLYARPDVPDGLGMMLHSYMPPCVGTFVPFYVGMNSVDNRFSTPEASFKFNTISTKSFAFYRLYIDGIRAAFDPYEASMFSSLSEREQRYMNLIDSGKTADAATLLNQFSAAQADAAMKAADQALENMKQSAMDDSAWE